MTASDASGSATGGSVLGRVPTNQVLGEGGEPARSDVRLPETARQVDNNCEGFTRDRATASEKAADAQRSESRSPVRSSQSAPTSLPFLQIVSPSKNSSPRSTPTTHPQTPSMPHMPCAPLSGSDSAQVSNAAATATKARPTPDSVAVAVPSAVQPVCGHDSQTVKLSKEYTGPRLRSSQSANKVRVRVKSPTSGATAMIRNPSSSSAKCDSGKPITVSQDLVKDGKSNNDAVSTLALSDHGTVTNTRNDSPSSTGSHPRPDQPAEKQGVNHDPDAKIHLSDERAQKPSAAKKDDRVSKSHSKDGEGDSFPDSASLPVSSGAPPSPNKVDSRVRKRSAAATVSMPESNRQPNIRASDPVVSSPTKRRRTGAVGSPQDAGEVSRPVSKTDLDGKNVSEAANTNNDDDGNENAKADENLKPAEKSNSFDRVTIKKDTKSHEEKTAARSDSSGGEAVPAQKPTGSQSQVRSKKRRRGTKRRMESRVDSRRRPTVTDDTAAPADLNRDERRDVDADRENVSAEVEIDLEALTYYPPPGASDPNAKHVDRPSGSGDEDSARDSRDASDNINVEIVAEDEADNRESCVEETPVRTRGFERVLRSRKRTHAKEEERLEENTVQGNDEDVIEANRGEVNSGVSTRQRKRRRAASFQVERHNKRTRSTVSVSASVSASVSTSGSSRSPENPSRRNSHHVMSSSSPHFEDTTSAAVVATRSRKTSENSNASRTRSNTHESAPHPHTSANRSHSSKSNHDGASATRSTSAQRAPRTADK